MGKHVPPEAVLPELVRMAVPLLQEAERRCPRTGPGAKPVVPDWVVAAWIMIAVLAKKKSKSAQYRYLGGRRGEVAAWLGTDAFLARGSYFRRYRRAHRLYQAAIRLQGARAVADGVVHPRHVAVDKSLLEAAGPPWHQRQRAAGEVRPGVDVEGAWGRSEHDGWVYGYSYEVVVVSTPRQVVFPLLASVDTAGACEAQTFAAKVADLPAATQTVSADSAYDANHLGEQVEYDADGRRTGRRFVCPENPRNSKRPKTRPGHADAARARSRQRRQQRRRFREGPRGRRIYARRKKTVEPFNSWFKALFDLEAKVWHRGLDNNRTHVLASIFAYQLLVRYNHRCGHKNGCIRWILDAL
jgi:hypothetical protein